MLTPTDCQYWSLDGLNLGLISLTGSQIAIDRQYFEISRKNQVQNVSVKKSYLVLIKSCQNFLCEIFNCHFWRSFGRTLQLDTCVSSRQALCCAATGDWFMESLQVSSDQSAALFQRPSSVHNSGTRALFLSAKAVQLDWTWWLINSLALF